VNVQARRITCLLVEFAPTRVRTFTFAACTLSAWGRAEDLPLELASMAVAEGAHKARHRERRVRVTHSGLRATGGSISPITYREKNMFAKTTLGSVLACVLLAVCSATGAEKAPVPLEDVLRAWETAGQSLRSYDVYLRVEYVFVLKSVVVGKKKPPGKAPPGLKVPEIPIIELRERPPGEPPSRRVEFSRQVLSKQGKRRYELWPSGSQIWIEAKVFDGEIVRSRSSRSAGTANIDGRGPDVKNFTGPELNYAALYWDMPYGGSIVKLFRARKGARLIEAPSGKADYVHIESAPEEGDYYPAFGWRIALDPAHGMMPAKIEFFRDTMKLPIVRTTIEEFHQVELGVWAPIKATHTYLDSRGRVPTEVHLAVDMTRSHWNQPVAEELFTLVIPEGTRVVDDTRNIAFVAGKGDTGKNLDALIENARNVVSPARPKPAELPPTEGRLRLLLLFGLNALVIAVILGIVYVRARKRRAARRA
jgi:hypothetical protein